MPNWKQVVRERLPSSRLKVSDRKSVVGELAGHLEETYESARSRGLTESEALDTALQEVADWRVLAVAIQRAKEEGSMNHRTKRLWLPALTTLLAASVSLTLLQYIGIRPYVVWLGNVAITLYWAWLATLPGFGALGAYLSQRAQAPAKARLAAGLAPALVMLIVMCLILPWGLAIDGFDFLRVVSFGLALTTWVAIPGAALLLGALPFLRKSEPALESTSH